MLGTELGKSERKLIFCCRIFKNSRTENSWKPQQNVTPLGGDDRMLTCELLLDPNKNQTEAAPNPPKLWFQTESSTNSWSKVKPGKSSMTSAVNFWPLQQLYLLHNNHIIQHFLSGDTQTLRLCLRWNTCVSLLPGDRGGTFLTLIYPPPFFFPPHRCALSPLSQEPLRAAAVLMMTEQLLCRCRGVQCLAERNLSI